MSKTKDKNGLWPMIGSLASHLSSQELSELKRADEEFDKRIAKEGGLDRAPIELVKASKEASDRLLDAYLTIEAALLDHERYLKANPLLEKRINAAKGELPSLLDVTAWELKACRLIERLRTLCRSPNWLDDRLNFAFDPKPDGSLGLTAGLSKETKNIVMEACEKIRANRELYERGLGLHLPSLQQELSSFIVETIKSNPKANPSVFDVMAKAWRGFQSEETVYEPLAGSSKYLALKVFYAFGQARLPEGQDPDSPTAKIWPSRKAFKEWLNKQGITISEAKISEMITGPKATGIKAWERYEEVRPWLEKHLGVKDATDEVVTEYFDHHNNKMPALSSLIGNARGKVGRNGKSSGFTEKS